MANIKNECSISGQTDVPLHMFVGVHSIPADSGWFNHPFHLLYTNRFSILVNFKYIQYIHKSIHKSQNTTRNQGLVGDLDPYLDPYHGSMAVFHVGLGAGDSPHGNGDPQVQSVNPTGDGAKSNVFSIVAAAKPDAPGRPVVDRRVGWLDGWMI
jgi:hypothetical protein